MDHLEVKSDVTVGGAVSIYLSPPVFFEPLFEIVLFVIPLIRNQFHRLNLFTFYCKSLANFQYV